MIHNIRVNRVMPKIFLHYLDHTVSFLELTGKIYWPVPPPHLDWSTEQGLTISCCTNFSHEPFSLSLFFLSGYMLTFLLGFLGFHHFEKGFIRFWYLTKKLITIECWNIVDQWMANMNDVWPINGEYEWPTTIEWPIWMGNGQWMAKMNGQWPINGQYEWPMLYEWSVPIWMARPNMYSLAQYEWPSPIWMDGPNMNGLAQ